MFCAACRQVRPVGELLAFWPVSDPGRRRHVCRPSLQRPEVPSCFRLVVGPANVHGIAFAVPVYAEGGEISGPQLVTPLPGERFVRLDGRLAPMHNQPLRAYA